MKLSLGEVKYLKSGLSLEPMYPWLALILKVRGGLHCLGKQRWYSTSKETGVYHGIARQRQGLSV